MRLLDAGGYETKKITTFNSKLNEPMIAVNGRSARASPAPWSRGARTSRATPTSGPRRSSRAPRRSPCGTDRSN